MIMMRKIKAGRAVFAGVFALAIWGMAGVSDARAACLDPTAEAAFAVHALRTELMVGALSCGRGEAYNTLITRHRGELSRQSRILGQAMASVPNGLDGLFTRLANDVSRRSVGEGVAACQRWDALFRAVGKITETPDGGGLEAFVAKTVAGSTAEPAVDGILWRLPDAPALTGLVRCQG